MQIKVTLSGTATINGVKVDSIILNELTVQQDLDITRQFPKDDDPERDLAFLAASAKCAPDDLKTLSLRNYKRVLKAFFRLSEDENVKEFITEIDTEIGP